MSFSNAMALANQRYKNKKNGDYNSIPYGQIQEEFISSIPSHLLPKVSDFIITNGKTVGISEDLSAFKFYTKNMELNKKIK